MLESLELLSCWIPLGLGVIAVALGMLCVGQFFSFRKRVRVKEALTDARDMEPLEATVAHLAAEMHELRDRLAEREAERPAPAGWGKEVTGVNLNRRGQVLRLRRRGRTVEEIATTLQMPRGEVELMVKVHELSQRAAGAAGAASSFSVDAR
jgi:hypothetical protein